MLLTFATLAVLAFCISIGVAGAALLRRGRGWRIVGGVLLAQALLATAALVALSTGFASNVFVQGTMDNPTPITFGPDNKLYIADISGAIWVAEDANHDGVAEDIKQFADGFSLLVGLAWHNGELYTASSGKIEA